MGEVDLSRYFRVLWRFRLLILLAVLLGAGASLIAVQAMPRLYRTSTYLLVGEDSANPTVGPDEQMLTQRALVSYMGMAKRQPVLEATVGALQAPLSWRTLQDQVVVVKVDGANIFEIRVIDTSPTRVQTLADEIARQLLLQSPAMANIQQNEERRRFVERQLLAIQANILQAEQELAQKQEQLGREVSARGVLERQDEIRALEAKLNNWRTSYAALVPAAAQTRGPSSLTVVERAFLPTTPVSPNVPLTIALAAVVGLLLGIGAALVLEFGDDTLRRPEDVGKALGLPVMGAIRSLAKTRDPQRRLITWADPMSPDAEAFRMLRTFAELAGRRETGLILLVTSPWVGEGKSFTSANLAVSFAQSGRSTILVDADLRHPSVHRHFGLANGAGLATLLMAERPDWLAADSITAPEPVMSQLLEQALLTTPVANLRVLPSGSVPPNPADLLGSQSIQQVLAHLRQQAEIIIIDSPPVLPVADTTLLATGKMPVILVVQSGKTRAGAARRALESLRRADALPIGVVLNRSPAMPIDYHHYPDRRSRPAAEADQPRLRVIRRG